MRGFWLKPRTICSLPQPKGVGLVIHKFGGFALQSHRPCNFFTKSFIRCQYAPHCFSKQPCIIEQKNENYLENVDATVKNDYFYTKKRQKCIKCIFLGLAGIYIEYKFWYVEYKFWYVEYKFWYVEKYLKVC